jgi:hypothetical protein
VHSEAQPELPWFKIDCLIKGIKMSSGEGAGMQEQAIKQLMNYLPGQG